MRRQQAFTILEMTTVLVIIASILGAISTGASLLKQSRLRAVIKESQLLNIAIANFTQQYNALPGDFTGAGLIWPACDNTSSTYCNSTSCVSSTSHCNGNGDGIIYSSSATSAFQNELFRAWQHLSMSGVLNAVYNMSLNSSNFALIGTSLPYSRYDSLDGQSLAGWSFGCSFAPSTGNSIYNNQQFLCLAGLAGLNGNVVSGCNTLCQIATTTNAVSPIDAYSIDVKTDDGYVGTGAIQAQNGYASSGTVSTNCTSSSYTSGYNQVSSAAGCTLMVAIDKNSNY